MIVRVTVIIGSAGRGRVHVVVTIRNFELSHLVIELLVCYLCIIDTLSSLVIMILGNEHNWEF